MGVSARTLCFSAALLIAGGAAAFVPVTSYLLGRHVEIRREGKLTDLKVELTTSLFGDEGEQRGAETIWYSAPWRMRSELVLDEGKRVRVRDGRREHVINADGKLSKSRARLDLVSDFFAAGDDGNGLGKERLLRTLTALGVDSSKRVLTRFDGRIAIVIGADPWDLKTPQVWLDKDGYFPLRFVYKQKSGEGEQLVDIRLLGYGGAKSGSWYPEVTEVWVDGKLRRRATVEAIEVGPDTPRDFFKVK